MVAFRTAASLRAATKVLELVRFDRVARVQSDFKREAVNWVGNGALCRKSAFDLDLHLGVAQMGAERSVNPRQALPATER